MNLRINLSSPIPAYRQIVDGLRILLVNGELSPGDQLPPVRRLGLDLGIHFNTVAEAYRTLEAEGWLEIGRRNGARVVARKTPSGSHHENGEHFEQRLRGLVAEVQARGFPPARIAYELRQVAQSLERNKP